jgi:hypothetical protein
MATGWPMKVSYADGDVYSASDVNDITGTINLLGSSVAYTAGKNNLLNSSMAIWQRGTSIAVNGGSNSYVADRWAIQTATASVNTTTSRQTTGDTTNLPFIQYCARVQRNSGVTANGFISIQQSLETSSSAILAGRAVTLSFYARKGANFSDASSQLGVQLKTGTGTDQNINSYTGSATPINSTATITATWQRFTFAGTVASTATEVGVNIYYLTTGTAGTNDYFEITGVQLEVGTATAFQTATGTIQGELAACQRYYEKSYAQGTNIGTATTTGISGNASGADTTGYVAPITTFKVTKRNTPSVTVYDTAGTINKVSSFNTAGTLTAGKTGSLDPISDTGFRIYETGTSKNGLFYHYVASSEL